MAKFQSPLLGYNSNVRHRGRVFHIQTEDSGIRHPHVITHLFMDGGRILKSVKTSYAEHVGADGMSATVHALMKEQHKAMLLALRGGQFDEIAFGTKEPTSVAPPAPLPSGDEASRSPEPRASRADVPAPTPPSADPRSPPATSAEPPLPPELEALLRDELLPVHPPATTRDDEPDAAREPERRSAQELTLDFDALERDAGPSPILMRSDLPPPPKSLFAAGPRTASRKPSTEGRYVSLRPTASFSDDLVSDKSLDEVILSYLAEDLDPPHQE